MLLFKLLTFFVTKYSFLKHHWKRSFIFNCIFSLLRNHKKLVWLWTVVAKVKALVGQDGTSAGKIWSSSRCIVTLYTKA